MNIALFAFAAAVALALLLLGVAYLDLRVKRDHQRELMRAELDHLGDLLNERARLLEQMRACRVADSEQYVQLRHQYERSLVAYQDAYTKTEAIFRDSGIVLPPRHRRRP